MVGIRASGLAARVGSLVGSLARADAKSGSTTGSSVIPGMLVPAACPSLMCRSTRRASSVSGRLIRNFTRLTVLSASVRVVRLPPLPSSAT